MLATTVSAMLLAAAAAVGIDFDLRQPAPPLAELQLCFRGTGQRVRFELQLVTLGPAGRSRSRQSGQLLAREQPVCPLRNSVRLPGASQVEARLRWWVDGVEQTPETRALRLGQAGNAT